MAKPVNQLHINLVPCIDSQKQLGVMRIDGQYIGWVLSLKKYRRLVPGIFDLKLYKRDKITNQHLFGFLLKGKSTKISAKSCDVQVGDEISMIIDTSGTRICMSLKGRTETYGRLRNYVAGLILENRRLVVCVTEEMQC